MNDDLLESEWKIFRALREMALERFCKRALDDVERLIRESSGRHHERYLKLFRLLQKRDRTLARVFDSPRRSRMLLQIAAIHQQGLLEPEEFARFGVETRESIESLLRLSGD